MSRDHMLKPTSVSVAGAPLYDAAYSNVEVSLLQQRGQREVQREHSLCGLVSRDFLPLVRWSSQQLYSCRIRTRLYYGVLRRVYISVGILGCSMTVLVCSSYDGIRRLESSTMGTSHLFVMPSLSKGVMRFATTVFSNGTPCHTRFPKHR